MLRRRFVAALDGRASQYERSGHVARHDEMWRQRQLFCERECLVVPPLLEQFGDEAGESKADRELRLATGTREVIPGSDVLRCLVRSVGLGLDHDQVVVGPERLDQKVVIEGDRKRLAHETAPFVRVALEQQRLRVQRLREHPRQHEIFGDRERHLHALQRFRGVAFEQVDAGRLRCEQRDALVGLVLGEHGQGRLEQVERLAPAPLGPECEAELGGRASCVVGAPGAVEQVVRGAEARLCRRRVVRSRRYVPGTLEHACLFDGIIAQRRCVVEGTTGVIGGA